MQIGMGLVGAGLVWLPGHRQLLRGTRPNQRNPGSPRRREQRSPRRADQRRLNSGFIQTPKRPHEIWDFIAKDSIDAADAYDHTRHVPLTATRPPLTSCWSPLTGWCANRPHRSTTVLSRPLETERNGVPPALILRTRFRRTATERAATTRCSADRTRCSCAGSARRRPSD